VCVCSLRYRAWNAHAPYCHLWPVRLYHISPNYLINGMIFGKKKFNIQCVFWTSLHLSAACFIRRTIQRNIIVNVHGYSCKVPVIFIRFQQGLNFLDKFLKKKMLKKISWESFQWVWSCAMQQTYGWTDVKKLIVLISNFRHVLNVVFFILGEFYVPTFRNTLFLIHSSCGQDDLRRWNGQSLPKLQHTKFRCRSPKRKNGTS